MLKPKLGLLVTGAMTLGVGPFFVRLPSTRLFIELYFKNFISLGALVVTFVLLREYLPAIANQQATTKRKIFKSSLMLLPFAIFLLSLQHLRSQVDLTGFLIILAAITFGVLYSYLTNRTQHMLAAIAALACFTLIGFLSALVLADSWSWQLLLFAMAVASYAVAFRLALILESTEVIDTKLIRTFGVLVILGPVIVIILAFLGQLPNSFLLAAVLIPLAYRQLKAAENKVALVKSLSLSNDTFYLGLIFVILMSVLRFI